MCEGCGIVITDQRARRITKEDFQKFDIVYALATDVLDEIHDFLGDHEVKAQVKLLLDESHPNQNRSVPDPWYGEEAGFNPVFHLIKEACEAIVKKYS
jgi:protein-tyrosine phosphatase